jgi:hypothetical protein
VKRRGQTYAELRDGPSTASDTYGPCLDDRTKNATWSRYYKGCRCLSCTEAYDFHNVKSQRGTPSIPRCNYFVDYGEPLRTLSNPYGDRPGRTAPS